MTSSYVDDLQALILVRLSIREIYNSATISVGWAKKENERIARDVLVYKYNVPPSLDAVNEVTLVYLEDNLRNERYMNIMQLCAQRNYINLFKTMLNTESDDYSVEDYKHVITTAVKAQRVEVISIFAESVGNLENIGEKPMKSTVKLGDLSMIELLLNNGAMVYNETLELAIRIDNPEIIKLMLKYNSRSNLLHDSYTSSYILDHASLDILNILSIDSTDYNEYLTKADVIVNAVRTKDPDYVIMLLENGYYSDRILYHIASAGGKDAVYKLKKLLPYIKDLRIEINNNNPLGAAYKAENYELAKLLIANGADVNAALQKAVELDIETYEEAKEILTSLLDGTNLSNIDSSRISQMNPATLTFLIDNGYSPPLSSLDTLINELYYDRENLAEVLIEKGFYKCDSVIRAFYNGKLGIFKRLIDAGCYATIVKAKLELTGKYLEYVKANVPNYNSKTYLRDNAAQCIAITAKKRSF